MNKPIRNLAVGCMLLFVALLINASYVQYWQADDLTSLSQHPDNKRVRDAEFARERGAILVKGKAVAESNKSDDAYKFQRTYPQGLLYAHLTGYFSRDWGLGGVEATQNSILSGSDSKLFVNRVVDLADNQAPKGGSVSLTIDPDAQQAAYDGLKALGGDARAAAVAIEPRTGRILAMVSTPSYNPNRLASHDFSAVGQIKQRLQESSAKPLDNRAIEEVYPPGSTFKLVTAAAALSSGRFQPDTKIPGGPTLDLPQTSRDLPNEAGLPCGDRITMTEALMFSCNVSFGYLGLQLGDDAIRAQAEKFGFGTRTFRDLDDSLTRQAISSFPADPDKPQTALSAIGQFDVKASPLQMAMVAAGIANDGTVMKPYLVDEIKSPKLENIGKTDPEPMPDQPAMSSGNARNLREMMVKVVQSGTAKSAQIPGVDVAGKTGTAQRGTDQAPYAWFTSFAPAATPAVAVAVFVDDPSVPRGEISGSGLAAPIAKSITEAVIGK